MNRRLSISEAEKLYAQLQSVFGYIDRLKDRAERTGIGGAELSDKIQRAWQAVHSLLIFVMYECVASGTGRIGKDKDGFEI